MQRVLSALAECPLQLPVPTSRRCHQILLGIGLSAYSWMNTPKAVLAECAYDGYLGCCPGCDSASQGVKVFHSDRRSHSSVGGNGHRPYRWDELQHDVAAGTAAKGRSNQTRGHYGPLSSHWVYYPSAANASTGELTVHFRPTFYSACSDYNRSIHDIIHAEHPGPAAVLERFRRHGCRHEHGAAGGDPDSYFACHRCLLNTHTHTRARARARLQSITQRSACWQRGYAGVYTWVSTSDAMDWRVHKHLHNSLADGARLKVDDESLPGGPAAATTSSWGGVSHYYLCE